MQVFIGVLPKIFLKITQPLTKLLEKDMLFEFTMECLAFETLKDKLVKALIVIAPDWNIPFEIMCDASDHTVKAILGQRRDKYFQPIYYTSRALNDAQENYIITEKELLEWFLHLKNFVPILFYRKS